MRIYTHKILKTQKIEFIGLANDNEYSFRYLGSENKNIFFNIPKDEVKKYWELETETDV